MSNQVPSPIIPESAWHKSSYSSGEGGECVEVATGPQTVHVRDSKSTDGPILTLTPNSWAQFVGLTASTRPGA